MRERNLTITYPLDAGALLDEVTPARLGSAYVYFCMTGQPADRGEVIARLPERYAAVTSGSPMTDEAIGLTTGNVEDPGDLFACVEGTVERNLTTDRRVMGPSDREVILQAPQRSGAVARPGSRERDPRARADRGLPGP